MINWKTTNWLNWRRYWIDWQKLKKLWFSSISWCCFIRLRKKQFNPWWVSIWHSVNFLAEESKRLITSFNDDQKMVYDTIMNSIFEEKSWVFFIYGYGETERHLYGEIYLHLGDQKEKLSSLLHLVKLLFY